MSKVLSLFESKTFDLALLTAVAAAAAVLGYNVPVATIIAILTPIMVGLGASGWSEVTAAKEATAIKLHFLAKGYGPEDINAVIHTIKTSPSTKAVKVPSAAPGFFKLEGAIAVMFVMTIVAGAVGITATEVGCGANPPPIVTDVIDCAKAEGAAIEAGLSVISVVDDVEALVVAAETGGVAGVLSQLASLVSSDSAELVACVIDEYPTTGSGSGSGTGSGSAPVVASARYAGKPPMDPQLKADLLAKVAPGKKIVHKYKKGG